jgi:hypothetical protein
MCWAWWAGRSARHTVGGKYRMENKVCESSWPTVQPQTALSYLDGIPKENFQANHPIVGSEVYQYGENIVVGIGGKYWLYENYHSTDLDGNPDGYDPLPNNQTSAEEVSEQDPAAN